MTDLIKEVTDDFVSAFPTEADCTGGFALCIAAGMIPEGVDESDLRVIEIVRWCKDYKARTLAKWMP